MSNNDVELRCVDPTKICAAANIILDLASSHARSKNFTVCESLLDALSLLPIGCTEIRTGIAKKLRCHHLSACLRPSVSRKLTNLRAAWLLVWRSGGNLDPRTHTLITPLREGGLCVGDIVMVNDKCQESYDICAGTTGSVVECLSEGKNSNSLRHFRFLVTCGSPGEILHSVPRNYPVCRPPSDRRLAFTQGCRVS